MALSCGILGLPNAGKSTLFRALTSIPVLVESYPFSTINPNTGMIPILDRRLGKLAELTLPEKLTPAYLEVIDVAGLVKGAHKGEGLGNQFLSHLREVHALIHVIGDFDESKGTAEDRDVEVIEKAETVNQELILADIDTLQNRKSKIEKKAQSGEKESYQELQVINSLIEYLNEGNLLRTRNSKKEEIEIVDELNLITVKQMVFVLNRHEGNINREIPDEIKYYAEARESPVISICAKLEYELQELDEEEREIFKKEYGLEQTALPYIIEVSRRMLGLITFFTIKGKETKAWLVKDNTTAFEAAGKIHTDMQKGFIAVEIITYEELMEVQSLKTAREKGYTKIEGKNYIIRDGDILSFRFSQ